MDSLMPHAALSYANLWFRTDQHLLASLEGGAPDAEAVRKVATKYKVVRGFPAADEDARSRLWQQVAKALGKAAGDERRSDEKVVERFAEKLGELVGGPPLPSAASKLLWFAGRHGVRIYDRQAVAALKSLNPDRSVPRKGYGWFAAAWDRQLGEHARRIDAVLAQLPRQLAWSAIPPSQRGAVQRVMRERWFRDRVFDKYLWEIGRPQATAEDEA